uniref:Tumor necrosis factor receptor superfamily member 5-like protein n=1 Tax=Littorina littorea TaxID=31216 RepID=A0A7G8Z9W0_LITLI|nr:tumor necrosis factor receptor superfamily member 5-like protein [Littorina littorea]
MNWMAKNIGLGCSYSLCVFTCLLSFSWLTLSAAERETYPLDSEIHCFKCPVGAKVATDCTENFTDPTCVPCGDHQYSDKENGNKHCSTCKPGCPKNGVETQACTDAMNRMCICEPGFHRYPIDPIDPHFECKPHSKCSEGEGVVYNGNFTHDTACEKCKAGSEYVDKSDPDTPVCRACFHCPSGTTLVEFCSLTSNTQCSVGNYTFDANVTTPATGDEQSRPLPGVVIFIIVYLVLVVLGALAAVALYIYMKRKRCGMHSKQKMALVLAIVLGLGLLFAGIFCVITCSDESERQPSGPGIPLMNGAAAPADGWSKEFIMGPGFNFLSNRLGLEWETFIHALPGWTSASTVIVHKKMENPHSVPNQIRACLQEWANEAPGMVTESVIRRELREVEQQELIDGLEEKYAEHKEQA